MPMNYSLPKEHSLTLVINGVPAQKLICTDEALKALVFGYLYNEGYITASSDVLELAFYDRHSRAEIKLAADIRRGAVPMRLSGFGGVSLGVSINIEKIPLQRLFGRAYVSSCAKEAEGLATMYAATGGMHCSALFDGEKLLMHYEDIGRHNSFDKLSGRCLLERIDAKDCLLITTGRVSEDMVKKAARLGISLIASYSTATENAAQLAERCGITLIGYIQKDPRVYSCEERLC